MLTGAPAVPMQLTTATQTLLVLMAFLSTVVVVASVMTLVAVQRFKSLKKMVEQALLSPNHDAVGVDITSGPVTGNLYTGELQIADLVLANPEGYRSRHLLHAERVTLEVDLVKLACCGPRRLFFHRCEASQVSVNVEGKWGSTNLQVVQARLLANSQAGDIVDRALKEKEARKPGSVPGLVVTLAEAVARDVKVEITAAKDGQTPLKFDMGPVPCLDSEEPVSRSGLETSQLVVLGLLQTVSKEAGRRKVASGAISCTDGVIKAALGPLQ